MRLWLGSKRGYFVDWLTQRWVQITGRRVVLADHPWLLGPVGATTHIGADFYEELAAQHSLEFAPNALGLMQDFAALKGPRFDPTRLHPGVAHFYENTSRYRVDMWSEWCGAFRVLGWLLSVVFSQRLQQLNMPLSPLETSRGMSSRVVHLVDPVAGQLRHVGWVRELVTAKRVVYVGDYSIRGVPGSSGPCVRVVFPLPNGSATVVLWPEALPDGSLVLHSDGKQFGDAGFYFVVVAGNGFAWVRYVKTMKEKIRVYAVSDTELGTDHEFKIWGLTYLRLHYKLLLDQNQK